MLKNVVLILLTISSLFLVAEAETILPGRLGSSDYYVVNVGGCDIYFYMTPEKHLLSGQIAHDLQGINLMTTRADPPSTIYELILQCTKHPEKDPHGAKIVNRYGDEVKRIAEDYFGIKIQGHSYDINANLNWEALVFHHDRLIPQHEYLKNLNYPIPPFTLVQDLTLIDWQMPQGTMSGTMVQDGEHGDRYFIFFYPYETVGTFYTESVPYAGPYANPIYPGHLTYPLHTAIAPMDRYGAFTPGSSKGKRISTVVRGVALTSDVNQMRSKAIELFLNRRHILEAQNEMAWEYDNGIVLKSLPKNMPSFDLSWIFKYPDKENVDISGIPTKNNVKFIQALAKLFDIECLSVEKVQAKRLIKKDGGFSRFDMMDFNVLPENRIVLINRSIIPDDYRYFNLAQDFSTQNLPWIQLYDFTPSMALEVPYEVFYQLSMTPIEEVIYTDKRLELLSDGQLELTPKLTSIIDVYIF